MLRPGDDAQAEGDLNGFGRGAVRPAPVLDTGAIAASGRPHQGELRFAVEARLDPFLLWRVITPRQRAIDLLALPHDASELPDRPVIL